MSDQARSLLAVKAKLRRGTELALGHPGATLDRTECSELLSALDALEAAEQYRDTRVLVRDYVPRQLLQAAETKCDRLADALRAQAWDIDGELCWCPDDWFDMEPDTGDTRPEDDHCERCVNARAVLAGFGSGQPEEQQPYESFAASQGAFDGPYEGGDS